jgi:hypothetical protein
LPQLAETLPVATKVTIAIIFFMIIFLNVLIKKQD